MGMNPWELFKSGGPLMYPILLCSIIAVSIIFEKFYYFLKIQIDVGGFKQKIFDLIKNNQIKEAVELCDHSASPIAKILRAGIIKFGCARLDIEESIQQTSLSEIPKLENRLPALVTIAHISPLMGFLGTAAGLASIFYTIQTRAGSLNPLSSADLSTAIWQALLATIGGLIVAIPAYLTYNYFVDRIDKYILEMERAANELVNFMCQLTENRT